MANDVSISIKAKNEASGAINQVKGDLGGLEKAGSGISSAISGIAAAGVVGVAVAGVIQLSGTVLELAKSGDRLGDLRESFNALARGVGQDGKTMLNAMREASMGMVADSDLILAANKALSLGVGTNAEQMSQLLRASASIAQATGSDVKSVFADVTNAIGRMSARGLAGLNINLEDTKVFDAYAAGIGTVADKLDDAQKKQALFNAVVQQSAGLAAPNADQFDRMDAAIQNAKEAMGEMFSPAVAVIAQNLADSVNQMVNAAKAQAQVEATDAMPGKLDSINKAIAVYKEWYDITVKALQAGNMSTANAGYDKMDMYGSHLAALGKEYNDMATLLGKPLIDLGMLQQGALSFQGMSVAIQATTVAAGDNAAAIANVQRQLAGLASQADVTGPALRSAFMGMAQVMGAVGAMQGLKQKETELNSLRQEWTYMGISVDEQQFRESQFLQETNTGLSDQRSEWGKATSAVQAHGAAVADTSRGYDDLLGKVKGVLSSATQDIGGADPSKVLGHDDSGPSENARRLGAIMNEGLINQPWLDQFKSEAPGVWGDLMLKVAEGVDVKTAAAQILTDFQAGLRPDLIDKGAVKERVKAMILGDQNANALATEIANELAAEMNIPLSQAMAAAGSVLGVSPTTGTGTNADGTTGANAPPDMTGQGASAGSTFIAGFSSTASGTYIVAKIVSDMASALQSWTQPGKDAGSTWGAGFMSTVQTGMAPALISLLVTLVTPGVVATIATNATQTTPPDAGTP